MKTKFLALCLAVLGLSGFGVAQASAHETIASSAPGIVRVNEFTVVAERGRYSRGHRYERGRHSGYHRRHYRTVRRVYYRHGRRVVVVRRVYY